MIELLSPAKNLECGIAAINAGADAVYIGAEKFSARSQAGNSLTDISALISHAHKYYARVYAAVNTIFTDAELEEANQLIHRLHSEGIDGVIIQDVGLLETDLPPVPLIASTQMHNHTPEKVLFLEKAGFSRAILARELSLSEIKTIRQKTSIELETFVHGAICVCYSGQCYMSYALGGRSGNRGVCAQPCRKYYALADDKGGKISEGYLLSLKDMNRSSHLQDLLDAGVTSFKIEGRLKDADYVMNVTAFYRQKLDAAIEGKPFGKSSSGRTLLDFAPDPVKSFSRGSTSYFLNGREKEMASHGTPQSTGEYIGRIKTLGPKSFTLDSHRELNAGDGVCFFDREGKLKGTEIYIVKGDDLFFETNEGLWAGASVYRNYDRVFQKSLKNGKTRRKIPVSIRLERRGKHLILSLEDEDGIKGVAKAELPVQAAREAEKALLTIIKQITSLGETEFEAKPPEINLDPMEFLPVKELNALRREAIKVLQEERLAHFPRREVKHAPNSEPYPATSLDYRGNVMNGKAKAFYLRHGVKSVSDALEKGPVKTGTVLMTTRYCLLHSLGLCDRENKKAAKTGGLYLIDEQKRKFKLRFDCADCRMEVVSV